MGSPEKGEWAAMQHGVGSSPRYELEGCPLLSTGLNFLPSLERSGGLTFEAWDLSLQENQWAYKRRMY